MAYETAVLKQLEAYTAKHISRMGGFSPHIRLTDYKLNRNQSRFNMAISGFLRQAAMLQTRFHAPILFVEPMSRMCFPTFIRRRFFDNPFCITDGGWNLLIFSEPALLQDQGTSPHKHQESHSRPFLSHRSGAHFPHSIS